MKKYNLFLSILLMFAVTGIVSCSKDPHYTPPSSSFTGSLLYNGAPIGVANNGQGGSVNGPQSGQNYNSVFFSLIQPGYPKNGAVFVVINQDGSFSDLLFNGSYKLSFPTGVYPFVPQNADTVPVTISGNTKLNINVTPYYMFDNDDFSLSSSDSIVTAKFGITQVITGVNALPLSAVYLYISRTSFVDNNINAAAVSIQGSAITDMSNIQLTLKVPSTLNTNGANGAAGQSNIYVRLGIQVSNRAQLLYSDIKELSF